MTGFKRRQAHSRACCEDSNTIFPQRSRASCRDKQSFFASRSGQWNNAIHTELGRFLERPLERINFTTASNSVLSSEEVRAGTGSSRENSIWPFAATSIFPNQTESRRSTHRAGPAPPAIRVPNECAASPESTARFSSNASTKNRLRNREAPPSARA